MYNYLSSNNEECISRGACSLAPNVVAMKEVMTVLLSQTAYYLLRDENFNNTCFDFLVNILADIDMKNDYSDEQLLNFFLVGYKNLKILKENDKNIAEFDGLKKNILKFDENLTLSSIIKIGEQLFQNSLKSESNNKKYLKGILFYVLKNLSINYLILKDYDIEDKIVQKFILKTLLIFDRQKSNLSKIKKLTYKLANLNVIVQEKIYKKIIQMFGQPKCVSVNSSTRKNKAILVSGTSFLELKALLDVVKGHDIDVYTNGNLLIAHAFPKFWEYANLRGQFGNSIENTVLDFATFPGSIVLTKREYNNTEYLYQGKFFGISKLQPKGICLTDKSYEKVIETSLNSRGFVKTNERDNIQVGIDYDELKSKIDEISKRLNSGELKNIIFVGLGTQSLQQYEYFQELYKLIDDNTFVISFSHTANIKNILHINISNSYPMLLDILSEIFKKIPINSSKISVYIMRCDVNSMTTAIYFKSKGVKNVFFGDCPAININPVLQRVFKEEYEIFDITFPKDDLKKIKKTK